MKNFFRFYKVNLKQECPFWPDDSRCAIRFCQVENCEEQSIPEGIKEKGEHRDKAASYKVREREREIAQPIRQSYILPSLSSTIILSMASADTVHTR